MDLTKRPTVERKILDKYFPGFTIDASSARGTLRSNSGTAYAVRIDLTGFPHRLPQAYITWPRLLMHNGVPLSAINGSSTMHVLAADAAGNPQVCHWRREHWLPEYTVYQVVMKVRIWLEAWERHAATGDSLDRFLPHA
ncbi:MAG: hypothetical protein V4850_32245 [Myxococcota bacterium]